MYDFFSFAAIIKTKLNHNIYVVVNFLSQVIFVFLLFLGMVMYANEVETKDKQNHLGQKLTTTFIFHQVQASFDLRRLK